MPAARGSRQGAGSASQLAQGVLVDLEHRVGRQLVDDLQPVRRLVVSELAPDQVTQLLKARRRVPGRGDYERDADLPDPRRRTNNQRGYYG